MPSEDERLEELQERISDWIADYGEDSVYPSYDDALPDDKISEILDSKSPNDAFQEALYDYYAGAIDDCYDEAYSNMENDLLNEENEDLFANHESELRDQLCDELAVTVDEETLLSQPVHCCVFLDIDKEKENNLLVDAVLSDAPITADAEKEMEKSSIAFLAETQGYSASDTIRFLKDNPPIRTENAKGFLPSLSQEIANVGDYNADLCFLKTYALGDLITMEEMNRWNEPFQLPIDKKTFCGFYDRPNYGGSTLEIELEEDFLLDSSHCCITPEIKESNRSYTLDNIYGLDPSWGWTEGEFSKDNAPAKPAPWKTPTNFTAEPYLLYDAKTEKADSLGFLPLDASNRPERLSSLAPNESLIPYSDIVPSMLKDQKVCNAIWKLAKRLSENYEPMLLAQLNHNPSVPGYQPKFRDATDLAAKAIRNLSSQLRRMGYTPAEIGKALQEGSKIARQKTNDFSK